MANCRIFKPTKTAMQSGRANTKKWVLEFQPLKKPQKDVLMGWNGLSSTKNQIRMSFRTKEDALAFAKRNKLQTIIDEPNERVMHVKRYSDNFSSKFRFE